MRKQTYLTQKLKEERMSWNSSLRLTMSKQKIIKPVDSLTEGIANEKLFVHLQIQNKFAKTI